MMTRWACMFRCQAMSQDATTTCNIGTDTSRHALLSIQYITHAFQQVGNCLTWYCITVSYTKHRRHDCVACRLQGVCEECSVTTSLCTCWVLLQIGLHMGVRHTTSTPCLTGNALWRNCTNHSRTFKHTTGQQYVVKYSAA